jgi:sugar/nucleoside kinase (ribokinase family)
MTFARRASSSRRRRPPGPSTGRCYVLVTPDGQRTMNTYLGAAQDLHPRDIHADTVAGAAITYLEGYLWDPAHAKEAFVKAAAIAQEAKRMVALTLSDAFCVDRWRHEFLHLVRSGTVDLLFANENELHGLYQTSDFDAALTALRADPPETGQLAPIFESAAFWVFATPIGLEHVPV